MVRSMANACEFFEKSSPPKKTEVNYAVSRIFSQLCIKIRRALLKMYALLTWISL